MMPDWPQTTLGHLCDDGDATIQTGPFGSQLHASDYVDQGVPVVPTEAITGGRIDHSRLPRITIEKAKELRRHALLSHDILFARRGAQATGSTVLVRDTEQGFICGTGAIRLRVSDRSSTVIPEFLSYVLASDVAITWIKHHAIGATMPNLNEGIIRAFSFYVPSLDEQRAICAVLRCLTGKLELNRKMSATLEAIARALFKSWFVDFDPVREKAEGRDPGLPAEIAALFPDSFEETDHGQIPSGWAFATISDIAMLNPEVWSKTTRPDVIRYVDLSTLKWGRFEMPAIYDRSEAPSRAQRVLRPGDTLVGTVRPANGSYGLVSDEWLTGSTGFAVLRPTRSTPLTYLAATSKDNIERLGHLADGGAYPAVRPEVVAGTQVVLSSNNVLCAFDAIASPLLHRYAQADRESRTLAALRDALLPKLISGELRVTDAERVLAASA